MADIIVKDTFLTIASAGEGLYKEKKSKFLSFAYPVQNEDQIKEILQTLRKQYFDARHHCYAYLLGETMENFRANDDGEPNHSAGDPILGQIRAKGLTNVLVVVVRYFGGTKLGVGGLIQAYRMAAQEALSNVGIVEQIVTYPIEIHFDYVEMNDVMKVVKDYELEITSQHFDSTCTINLLVRKRLKEEVQARLNKITNR